MCSLDYKIWYTHFLKKKKNTNAYLYSKFIFKQYKSNKNRKSNINKERVDEEWSNDRDEERMDDAEEAT